MRMKTLLLSSLAFGGALFGSGCIGGGDGPLAWSWIDFAVGILGSSILTPLIAGLGVAT